MKHYLIKKVDACPNWSNIPVLNINTPYLETSGVAAWGQVCYGDDCFFVHLWASVPEVRAVEQGRTGTPCEDSCLEFFFQPVAGEKRYINLEFNFNGCYFLGIGTNVLDLLRILPEENWENFFSQEIRNTADGWEIFYRIPFAFVRQLFPGFSPSSGQVMRANCYACSDLTEPSYYLSWNPVPAENFTFHRSDFFGEMELE